MKLLQKSPWVRKRRRKPVRTRAAPLAVAVAHGWDTHGALTAGTRAAYLDRSGAPYNPLYPKPTIFASTMPDVMEQIIARDSEGDS